MRRGTPGIGEYLNRLYRVDQVFAAWAALADWPCATNLAAGVEPAKLYPSGSSGAIRKLFHYVCPTHWTVSMNPNFEPQFVSFYPDCGGLMGIADQDPGSATNGYHALNGLPNPSHA